MSDLISRQAAIERLKKHRKVFCKNHMEFTILSDKDKARVDEIDNAIATLVNLPSAQPGQHTCVNCGRTVNNGGWYADGGTRCPIEEHYALPKDGYCHLWEKRNVTDDDYPERRTDGEIIPE